MCIENNFTCIDQTLEALIGIVRSLKNDDFQMINNNIVDSDNVQVTTEGGLGNQKAISAGEDIEDNFSKNKKNKNNDISL